MEHSLDRDRLYERVRVLFGVETLDGTPAPQGGDSPYSFADDIKTFDVPVFSGSTEPEDGTDAWLTTPNPAFGNRCPREFLDGDQTQRAFLESILSSFEDGAFS